MSHLAMLTRYKLWADELVYAAVRALPEGEATRARATRFGNIGHTLNHVHVIDLIFQAHLQGRPHGFSARNTPTHPPLDALWESVASLDRWYVDYAAALSDAQANERVEFRFVDGGSGAMTRGEMILHAVNHATYHRGFVGDMMYQVPVTPPATDLPVFLRDVPRS